MEKEQYMNITDRIYNATTESFDIISTTATVTGMWNCLAIFDTTVFPNDTTSMKVVNYSPNNPTPSLETKHKLDFVEEGINLSTLNGVVPNGFLLPRMYYTQIKLTSGIVIAFK